MADALPHLAVCPASGMAYRLMDDGLWHPLDVLPGTGDLGPPLGAVRYVPTGELTEAERERPRLVQAARLLHSLGFSSPSIGHQVPSDVARAVSAVWEEPDAR